MGSPGLVRSNKNISTQQSRYTRIFDEIVVPADKHTNTYSPGRIKNRKIVAAGNIGVFKGMQLPVYMSYMVFPRIARLQL